MFTCRPLVICKQNILKQLERIYRKKIMEHVSLKTLMSNFIALSVWSGTEASSIKYLSISLNVWSYLKKGLAPKTY